MSDVPPNLAIVDAGYAGTIGTRPNGVKIYPRVGDALTDAPTHSTTPYIVLIKNGHYREKLTINKPFITLVGENQDKTVITFDIAADTKNRMGRRTEPSKAPRWRFLRTMCILRI